eukprot:gene24031-29080_t
MGTSYLLGAIAFYLLTKFIVKAKLFGAVPLTSPISDFSYTSVTWTSTGDAYACGASGGGLVARSSDTGVTWTRVGLSTVFGPLSDITSRSLTATTWWLAVDTNRYIYTSNVTGTTWTRPARLSQSLNSVSIGSNGNAYVAGDSATLRASGTVSYSSDSGSTWTAASSTGTTDTIRCVEQIANTNNSLAWAGGDSGYLAYTNNGGDTWTKQVTWAPTVGATFFTFPVSRPNVNGNSTDASNSTASSTNASVAVGVLSSMSSSLAEIVVVTEEVRVVSQVVPRASPGASISIALPLTEAETVLQEAGKLVLPSISLFSSANSSSNANTT